MKILILALLSVGLTFAQSDPDNNTFFHPDRNWKGQIRTDGGSQIYIWCFIGCVDTCDNTSYPGDCDPICNQICQPFIGNPGALPAKPADFIFDPQKMLMNLWQRLQVSWSAPRGFCERKLRGI